MLLTRCKPPGPITRRVEACNPYAHALEHGARQHASSSGTASEIDAWRGGGQHVTLRTIVLLASRSCNALQLSSGSRPPTRILLVGCESRAAATLCSLAVAQAHPLKGYRCVSRTLIYYYYYEPPAILSLRQAACAHALLSYVGQAFVEISHLFEGSVQACGSWDPQCSAGS